MTMDLPGYDDWKTHNPADDCCQYCGADPRYCRGGWQPDECNGECGRSFRDPDYERDLRIEDEPSSRSRALHPH
jgi:hypothetical protein